MRNSQFSTTQKKAIVAKLNSGTSAIKLGRKYGVHYTTIYTWKKALTPTTKTSSKTTVSKVVKGSKVSSVKSKVVSDLTSLRKENLKLKSAYNTLVSKVKEVYTFVA